MSEAIRMASVFSPVLPLLAGLVFFRRMEREANLFMIYVLVGFLVDLIGISDWIKNNTIFNLFGLFESLFWVNFLLNRLDKTSRIVRALVSAFVLAFFCIYHAAKGNYWLASLAPLFHTVTFLLISFFSSIILVLMVLQKTDAFGNALFWLTAGIFFYTFSTTFFFTFISDDELRERIWWVHNLLNITTQLIYCFAVFSEGVFKKSSTLKISQRRN